MKKLLVSLTASSLFLVAACGDTDREGDDYRDLGGDTLATVNGEAVSEELLNAFIAQYPNVDPASIPTEQRDQLADHIINLVLLTAEAERRGLSRDPEVRAAIALERMQTLADRMIRQLEEDEPVSDEEIQALYDERFGDVREYRASHILVDDETLANELLARVQAGEDFADLATEYSRDGSATDGGDLGWFNADQMVPPFAEAVRRTEVGTVRDEVVETNFGWHLVKVVDSRDGDAPAMEEVREDLVNRIRQEKVQRYVSELRENAEVEKH
ncbi:foldase protein PrsA [Natronospira bacteriovora]|uniref:peptidylprolyl isomerase n=1 Tax=Natronospira bacteriovora TaxID=3069753 RepID=A0ABU0W5G0_9GAMM|nr:peptidylprolyl isomerase [Natronospira sp. AB-CW4]MDQ2069158.1 peptidylprolyl isomerase [Natronospira sp. AB-CW4]